MLALCQEQLRLELDAELSAVPLQRAKLEQLVSASRENHLARLSKIYEKEVAELKKRIDSQNWEEMKTLAKRHKDKNELARWVVHRSSEWPIGHLMRFRFINRHFLNDVTLMCSCVR